MAERRKDICCPQYDLIRTLAIDPRSVASMHALPCGDAFSVLGLRRRTQGCGRTPPRTCHMPEDRLRRALSCPGRPRSAWRAARYVLRWRCVSRRRRELPGSNRAEAAPAPITGYLARISPASRFIALSRSRCSLIENKDVLGELDAILPQHHRQQLSLILSGDAVADMQVLIDKLLIEHMHRARACVPLAASESYGLGRMPGRLNARIMA